MSGETKTPVLRFLTSSATAAEGGRPSPTAAPWEQKPFAKIADRKTTMGSDSELPRVEYEDVIPFRGALNKDVFLKASGKTGVRFLKDDVLFGKLRPYLGNWFFAEFNGLAVGDWWVLKARESVPEFLYALIQSPSFQDLANQSSGSKMPRADWSLVSDATFDIPSSPTEQQSIGGFFRELDALIAEREKALGKLESLKKAMLEKMFPQGDAKVPEVRFKGFEGEWEEKKLGTSFGFGVQNNTLSRSELSFAGTVRNIHYGDVLIKFGSVLDVSKDAVPFVADKSFKCTGKNRLADGDIVMADTAEDEAVGKVTEIRGTENAPAVSGLHTIVLRPLCKYAEGFLGYSLNAPAFHERLVSLMQGIKVLSINKGTLAETVFLAPAEPAEQQEIGSFFRSLDALLAARREEAEKLKQLKKAFLERMFA